MPLRSQMITLREVTGTTTWRTSTKLSLQRYRSHRETWLHIDGYTSVWPSVCPSDRNFYSATLCSSSSFVFSESLKYHKVYLTWWQAQFAKFKPQLIPVHSDAEHSNVRPSRWPVPGTSSWDHPKMTQTTARVDKLFTDKRAFLAQALLQQQTRSDNHVQYRVARKQVTQRR